MSDLTTYTTVAALAERLSTATAKPVRCLLTSMPATAALIWVGTCGVGFAQVRPMPGMGATSPVGTGTSGFNAQPNGIPLGATELNPGGLSPPSCAGTTAFGNGLAGPLSTFEGGSFIANSSACSSSTAGNSAGTGGPPQVGSTIGPTAGNSTTIPLGSTDLATPGESPVITNPAPSIPNPDASAPKVAAVPVPSLPSSPLPSSPTTPCLGTMNASVAGVLLPNGCSQILDAR
jgi:hypothetical protein